MAKSSRRTLTPSQWEVAAQNQAVLPEDTNTVVDLCMAELRQGQVLSGIPQSFLFPWEDPPHSCMGVVWSGVPNLPHAQKDENGGWLLSSRRGGRVLRLSPAPVDAPVQFGMCKIHRNLTADAILREFGEKGPGNVRYLNIGPWEDSVFRVDKMVLAFVDLKASRGSTGQRFRELLGKTTLHEVLVSMLDGLYRETSSTVGGKHLLGNTWAELCTMVVEEAYPHFRTDLSHPDKLRRFRTAMELSLGWSSESLFPTVYNVVVPETIFQALGNNLEKNIPPLIPLYRTHHTWMFNGEWRDACTGLNPPRGLPDGQPSSPHGWAVVAGCINQFNLDLPGPASYWPESAGPPTNWINQFVRVIQDLGNSRIPASLEERRDHVMDYARRIPVVFHMGNHGNVFARLVDSERQGMRVDKVTTRRCNETGTDWLGDPLKVGGTPSTSSTQTAANTGRQCDVVNCANRNEDDSDWTCSGPGCRSQICDYHTEECDQCCLELCPTCITDHNCIGGDEDGS